MKISVLFIFLLPSFFLSLFFFILLHCTWLKNYRVYNANALHTKQLLYFWRCSFSSLEVGVTYDWQATASNTHHSHFSMHTCNFVHLSRITQNYGNLMSTKSVACKSKAIEQNVGVVYLWMCQEVGMAMYKMFTFLVSLTPWPRSQMPHIENMQFMIGELWLQLYITNSV